MIRRNDVLFNSDTGYWIESYSWGYHGTPSIPHPLLTVLWRFPAYAMYKVLARVLPIELAKVVSGRILNAVVAGLGVGCLAFVARRRGVSPVRCLILLAIYLLFTVQLLVALPEHFGLSNGWLSATFAVAVSDLGSRAKAGVLALLAFILGGITITNVIFPLAAMALILPRSIGDILTRFASLRTVATATAVAGLAIAALLAFTTRSAALFENARIDQCLHFRLFRSPGRALLYTIYGLVYPAIGPPPSLDVADRLPMVSYEPFVLWPYGVLQGVSAVVWLVLLGTCFARAVSEPATQRPLWLLVLWLAFNLTFHNVWSDELFLYSSHWSWSLMSIVLLGARDYPLRRLLPMAVILMAGQVQTLWQIHNLLAGVV
jgi:hypothetical protein